MSSIIVLVVLVVILYLFINHVTLGVALGELTATTIMFIIVFTAILQLLIKAIEYKWLTP